MTYSPLAQKQLLDTNKYQSHTRGRRNTTEPRQRPKWIVIHSAICCDGNYTGAENLATYMNRGADGRRVSWHYNTDRNSIVQTLPETWMGRHTGSSITDQASIAIEMAVNVPSVESTWLNNPAYNETLKITARLVADICDRNGIPKEALTAAQMSAGQPGVISHNLSRIVHGGTSHTDPGKTFPWPAFMDLVRDQTNNPAAPVSPPIIPQPDNETESVATLGDLNWLYKVTLPKVDAREIVAAVVRRHLKREMSPKDLFYWETVFRNKADETGFEKALVFLNETIYNTAEGQAKR